MKTFNGEKLEEYYSNIEKISSLLSRNEELIREEGYNPPLDNFTIEKENRIKMPQRYIRTSKEFWIQYHLNEIVDNRNTKNNISYALQLSDYYNYLVNRFYIWGSIEIMLYKQAFVNIVSIIEALILKTSNNINKYCQKCPKIGQCGKNLTKDDRSNMKKSTLKLWKLGILDFEEEEIKEIIDMYDYRNKIHIRLNEQNEFLDNIYNMELYNRSISYSKRIDDKLWKHGVPYYELCMGFEKKTERNPVNSDL